MDKPLVRISVRNLVEFILRSGDLDNRRGMPDKEAMQKGSRLHRKIQGQMGSHYRAEVSLKRISEYEDVVIVVEGRADGIFNEDSHVFIDEIKGIYADPGHLEKPVAVHRAQAMCYARIYGESEKLSSVGVQMTYISLDTEQIRRFREQFSMEELAVWYDDLLESYHKWISFQLAWRRERNLSMNGLEFPFPYRAGQRQMVTGIYHSISTGKQIFIQAPTGVGKTMSAIFPAVRAVGEGKGDTVFYLTAKTITRTVAEEAFDILRENGLKFKTITITAKEKLCLCEETLCNPGNCPYALGHYDRINDAVYELWTSFDKYDREILTEHARKWQVCPFEMCLDLAVWADGIICDYNYVFDPDVCLKRFFGDGVSGNYIFLIDEAHNLVDRGREMYSACICREDVMETRRKVKAQSKSLGKALDKVSRQLLEMKKSCDHYEILKNTGPVSLSLLQVMGEMDKFMENFPNQEMEEELLDFYFCVRNFLYICELVDENYVVYTENGEDGKFRLKLFCVNPAVNLQKCLEKGMSAVFFSATLLPMDYYRRLLSTRSDDYGVYVRSPFSQEKRRILTGYDVSSRYTRRNYEEYKKIASYIARTVWQRKGNYMVFFPSYNFMEEVRRVYEAEFSADWVRCIFQTPGMREKEREEFLEEFRENQQTLVGFCVLGGVFSEGIDLMGDRLIGTIIVGTGIPQIGTEREILKEYYDKKGEKGFDYAYRYPGMNKVLQAAGRVIRTQEDVGVILLLDERFSTPEYGKLFPVEWEDRLPCRLDTVEGLLEQFWKDKNGK
ncbi:MAG: ATP-dependent DNA helicase [Blautia sp.]|nr:ATP-dependent DNA helicase [Blautia sp.]